MTVKSGQAVGPKLNQIEPHVLEFQALGWNWAIWVNTNIANMGLDLEWPRLGRAGPCSAKRPFAISDFPKLQIVSQKCFQNALQLLCGSPLFHDSQRHAIFINSILLLLYCNKW